MLPVSQLITIYTTEQVLVILLTRLYFGTQSVNDVQNFIDGHVIDWDRFYYTIAVNQVRGFIYDIIATAKIKTSTDILNQLQKDAIGITRQGLYQFKLTQSLLKEFDNLGVRVIPYKGAVLATQHYKTPFLRESNDIDFLVNKKDIAVLRSYFRLNGYTTKFDADDKYLPFIMRFYRDLSFTSPKREGGLCCSVEIQWQLIDSFFGEFPDYEHFIQHLNQDAKFTAISKPGLSPVYDFVCTASHHLIKEPLWKFKYLVDMACIVNSYGNELNWETVVDFFKKYNFQDFLFSGMSAMQEIAGIGVPENHFKPVSYKLFMPGKYKSSPRLDLLQLISVIHSKQNIKQRLNFNLKVFLSLFTPNLKDLSLIDLPAWALPLLIPLKPFRLLYDYMFNKNKV